MPFQKEQQDCCVKRVITACSFLGTTSNHGKFIKWFCFLKVTSMFPIHCAPSSTRQVWPLTIIFFSLFCRVKSLIFLRVLKAIPHAAIILLFSFLPSNGSVFLIILRALWEAEGATSILPYLSFPSLQKENPGNCCFDFFMNTLDSEKLKRKKCVSDMPCFMIE